MADDSDLHNLPPTRQRRFKPNKPRSKDLPVKPKEEIKEADEVADEVPENLIHRVNEHLARGKSRADKKTPQVAFGPGSSQGLKPFGKPRQVAGKSNSGSVSNSAPGNRQKHLSLPYTAETDDGVSEAFTTDTSDGQQKIKVYREPWDYESSYYPITLPLRKPGSGDPEILDEAEFGKAATNLDHDENSIDAASELGLREKVDQQRLLFFQLPKDLPVFRGSAAAIRETTNKSARDGLKVTEEHNLELSKGFMGKMLVYKSGAVKLKLGEILYDVSPGSDCAFAQQVAAINTSKKYFCELGELDKRAIVTPDIDSLLESGDE